MYEHIYKILDLKPSSNFFKRGSYRHFSSPTFCNIFGFLNACINTISNIKNIFDFKINSVIFSLFEFYCFYFPWYFDSDLMRRRFDLEFFLMIPLEKKYLLLKLAYHYQKVYSKIDFSLKYDRLGFVKFLFWSGNELVIVNRN
jgi:hypothetical protein